MQEFRSTVASYVDQLRLQTICLDQLHRLKALGGKLILHRGLINLRRPAANRPDCIEWT